MHVRFTRIGGFPLSRNFFKRHVNIMRTVEVHTSSTRIEEYQTEPINYNTVRTVPE